MLEDFFGIVGEMLQDGAHVNTPLVNFRTSIKSTFSGPLDGFDPSRHEVVTRVVPGKRLRKVLSAGARVLKLDPAALALLPLQYLDANTGAADSTLTPAGMGQLGGRHLKFDPSDPAQGVFFVASDGRETRVEVVGRNKPSELSFLVPALAAGEYTLQVRAAYNGNPQVRQGQLAAKLVVR